MFEIARQLEQTAVWFEPAVLIVPGIAAVLLGLFVWLGGLGFRRGLAAVIGAVSGGGCGFFMCGGNIPVTMISAVIAMVVAVIFERLFVAILTAVLAAVICFAVLAGPCIGSEDSLKSSSERETEKITMVLDVKESLRAMEGYAVDFAAETKRIFSLMPAYNWAIMAATAAIFVAAGFFRPRLTSAFCCAVLGVMLISAGMTLLLLYKGAAPISTICQNVLFYAGIFGLTAIFGMAEQLLLCQRIQEKLTEKRQKSKNGKEQESVSENWRGR